MSIKVVMIEKKDRYSETDKTPGEIKNLLVRLNTEEIISEYEAKINRNYTI